MKKILTALHPAIQNFKSKKPLHSCISGVIDAKTADLVQTSARIRA